MEDRDGHRLLKRAESSAIPFLALPAIVALRGVLDDLELRAVRQARAKGASWEDIGHALGVSRQAVQQRFRALRVGSNDGKAAAAEV